MVTTATTNVSRSVTVRRARPGDERAIHALFGALHAGNAALEPRFALAAGWEARVTEQLDHERLRRRSVTLLAWDGGAPVGLAMVAAHDDSPLFERRRWAELTALYVAPEARRRGVADQLVAAGLAWARDLGHDEVRLYVTATNDRARRFYDAAGFRPLQEVWTTDLAPAVAGEGSSGRATREAA